jgi:pimeloyl-ACP methyl ester carboxylesterase
MAGQHRSGFGRLLKPAVLAAAGAGSLYALATTSLALWLVAGHPRRAAAGPDRIWPRHEGVEFPSREPGLRLRGWLFTAGSGRGRLVFVFVSGFGANRIDSGWGTDLLARRLLEKGHDVLLFDNRSRGESGGRVCTYGNREGADLLGAVDFLEGRGYAAADVAVAGGSLGGAIVMLAAPDLPEVRALVTDSAFADMESLVERSRRAHPWAAALVAPGIELAQRLLFGIRHDVRPLDRVRSTPDRAFLFIHGREDATVPPDHAERLAAASPNPRTQLWLVPGAGHLEAFHARPDEYVDRLLEFVEAGAAISGGTSPPG